MENQIFVNRFRMLLSEMIQNILNYSIYHHCKYQIVIATQHFEVVWTFKFIGISLKKCFCQSLVNSRIFFMTLDVTHACIHNELRSSQALKKLRDFCLDICSVFFLGLSKKWKQKQWARSKKNFTSHKKFISQQFRNIHVFSSLFLTVGANKIFHRTALECYYATENHA